MATRYWDGSAGDNDWSTAANWTGAAVPVGGDDVIFDGRTSESATAGMDQDTVDLGSMTVRDTYSGDIGEYTAGVSQSPLLIQCAGTMLIGGTGTYRIQCSANGAADGDIAVCTINTKGTVHLSSRLNAGANVHIFTILNILRGTTIIHGDSDKGGADGHGGESGTAIGTLNVVPGTSCTVTVMDLCEDFKAASQMDVIINGGTVTHSSSIEQIDVYGGTLIYGSSSVDQDIISSDNIALLNISGGTFRWEPMTGSGATCSHSPVITLANIYGGKLDATGMLNTVTADPLISTIWQYAGSVDLRNTFANFDVTAYHQEGGTLQFSPGQIITFA